MAARACLIYRHLADDPSFRELSPAKQSLAIALLLASDDEGRVAVSEAPKLARRGVLGYGLLSDAIGSYGGCDRRFAKILSDLSATFFLDIYKVAGKTYVCLLNKRKFQRLRHLTPSSLPGPQKELIRQHRRQRSDGVGSPDVRSDVKMVGDTPTPPSVSARKGPTPSDLDPGADTASTNGPLPPPPKPPRPGKRPPSLTDEQGRAAYAEAMRHATSDTRDWLDAGWDRSCQARKTGEVSWHLVLRQTAKILEYDAADIASGTRGFLSRDGIAGTPEAYWLGCIRGAEKRRQHACEQADCAPKR